ncbi:UDP-N-acetylmuramoylalanine--D-glutamate ligase [Candidatus Nitrosacidococcus sp. I8]|nr:UDP-N-acetylmuramoylalanine--D-glutamate ligase [Candidatus Nitrosacidococcus sp. I8]
MSTADRLIVSPGVSIHDSSILEAQRIGIPILGDIELFAHYAKAPVIAITGSNGKSTVTLLVDAMVRKAGKQVLTGGNLGVPALTLLEKPTPDFYVLELSSFQLETTYTLKLESSCILNISPDHMDRYSNIESYIEAKLRIYQNAKTIVINKDDPYLSSFSDSNSHCIYFTLNRPKTDEYGIQEQNNQIWLAKGNELILLIEQLPIKGRHNWANALAALALGESIGLPLPAMANALREFHGLPHRCQTITCINGVDWFNDSKGTNVGATLAALEGLPCHGKIILIAGGIGKGADFRPLYKPLAERAKALILMGRDADRIATDLAGSTPVYQVSSMIEAVNTAHRLAFSEDCVLLSPACASFDMFSGFEARGEAFVQAVRAIQP